MKGDVHQCIMIFDMEVMSSSNSPPLSQQVETMKILSAHYPERMFKAFFTFQPFIFTLIFNMLWPFLEERQQAKINLLGSSNFLPLFDFIDGNQLEVKYGGERDYFFDSADFLKLRM